MSESIIKNKSFKFSLRIIKLYKKLLIEKEYIISRQLLKSGTSIGANIEELIRMLTAIVKTSQQHLIKH